MTKEETCLSSFHLPLSCEARSKLAYLARYYEDTMPHVASVLLMEKINKEFLELVMVARERNVVTADEVRELVEGG